MPFFSRELYPSQSKLLAMTKKAEKTKIRFKESKPNQRIKMQNPINPNKYVICRLILSFLFQTRNTTAPIFFCFCCSSNGHCNVTHLDLAFDLLGAIVCSKCFQLNDSWAPSLEPPPREGPFLMVSSPFFLSRRFLFSLRFLVALSFLYRRTLPCLCGRSQA